MEAGKQVSHPSSHEKDTDIISIAPGSQGAAFLGNDEEGVDASVAHTQTSITSARLITSLDVNSPNESEVDDSSVSSKDQLRTRVYKILLMFHYLPS